jgi:ubiquinol oxidase
VFDIATGYKSKPIPSAVLAQRPLPVAELRSKGLLLSNKAWLLRIILLESIAGVPGMVAGTLRHLRSLRLLVGLIWSSRMARADRVPETRWRLDTYASGRG